MSDIQREVESSSVLSTEDKAEVLEQLITLAEAGQYEEIGDSRSNRMTRIAVRVLRGIIEESSQRDIVFEQKYKSLLNDIISIFELK